MLETIPETSQGGLLNNNPEVALTNLELNGGCGAFEDVPQEKSEGISCTLASQVPVDLDPRSSSTMTSSSSRASSCTLPFSAASSRPQTATACNQRNHGLGSR